MNRVWTKKKTGASGMPAVLAGAFLAVMVAMAVLPMATPSGAAAQDLERHTRSVLLPAPELETTDVSAAPRVKPGVVVTINKTECPAGYNAADATFRDLMTTCQTPMAGVQFAIGTKAGWEASGFTDGVGQLVFPRLPVWGYMIWETTPAGYGWPEVYCETFSPTYPNGSGLVEEEVWNGNTIGIGPFAAEPYEVVCYWFNVPLEDETADGSITIYAYTCPAGYDLTARGADLAGDCSTPTDGVDFALISQWSPPLNDITGSAGSGAVTFGGLDAGSYVVRQQTPAGTIAIDCQGAGRWVGNDLPIELTYGENVACSWYNVPVV